MKSFALRVPAQVRFISQVVEVVSEAANHANLDSDDVFRCQLVTDEACSNIIEHAYENVAEGTIEVRCFAEPKHLEINLYDTGVKFNPVEKMPYEFPPNLSTLEPGGLGLQLMYHYMDVVQFLSTDDHNHLKMIKTPSNRLTRLHKYEMQVYESDQGPLIIMPRGQLDSAFAFDLDHQIGRIIADGHRLIVLDLRDSTYIVSRVISTVVKYWRLLSQQGGALVISNTPPRVATVISLIGLDSVMEVFSSRQAALDKLASMQSNR